MAAVIAIALVVISILVNFAVHRIEEGKEKFLFFYCVLMAASITINLKIIVKSTVSFNQLSCSFVSFLFFLLPML